MRAMLQLFRRADVHKRVPHGEDFNHALLHAVVDPVIVMVAEDLADFGAVEFRKRLASKFWVGGKARGNIARIAVESDCIVKVEVVGNVVESGCRQCSRKRIAAV